MKITKSELEEIEQTVRCLSDHIQYDEGIDSLEAVCHRNLSAIVNRLKKEAKGKK